MPARYEIPVPAQHGLGAHQQPDLAEHVAWYLVQQGGQERPVAAEESRGRVVPNCRSRTAIWWRSANISTSLSRSLIGRSSSNANAFVTLS
jgi:hypothetical protein